MEPSIYLIGECGPELIGIESECGAEYEWADGSGCAVCERLAGHVGPHRDPVHDWEWPDPDAA